MATIDAAFEATFTRSKSQQFMDRAKRSIAGGDSSTMRVLPYHLPLVADRGEGSRVWDIDGREFIDLNMAYGPLLLGHCPRQVIDAVCRQISEFGSQLGFPTEITVHAAEKVKQLFPSMELLRFANSGTEACASAVRLARTHTKRSKLVMFEGHYHGWSEAVFNRYHAPLADLPTEGFGPAIPGTAGMSPSLQDVIVCEWNDLDAFARCLQRHGEDVAACIMEPVMANAGVCPPEPNYLEGVRDLTWRYGSLLIFDEVITGFRVAPGGAQERYDVRPDITVVSKSMAGGYPAAAFGASREIMQAVLSGAMFHGGVFSGNAIVMAAANAVLDEIISEREVMYTYMSELTDQLASGFSEILNRLSVPHLVQYVGPLLGLLLTNEPVGRIRNYREMRRHCRFDKYIELQHAMQNAGVYYHPNQFEPMFLSTAHTQDDIGTVLERFEDAARATLVP